MTFFRSALLAGLWLVSSATMALPLATGDAPTGGRGDIGLPDRPWRNDDIGGVDADVLALALRATACAVQSGTLAAFPPTLTVIDYSKPSTAERLWVFDMRSKAVLYKELVAHGQGSGDNLPTRFSNDNDSHQSSLGLFVTEGTYVGKNGYSLRLKGLDEGFNDHASARAIVMHGAPYVTAALARTQGRLGRSWGCPALREPIAREVIDRVKGGGVIFSYAQNADWLRQSKYLVADCGAALGTSTLSTF